MVTRRSFMGQVGLISAAAPFLTEAALAKETRANAPAGLKLAHLDSNENPLGPPASAIEAIRRGAPDVGRYCFEEIAPFAQSVATLEQVKAQEVLVGVGSSDIITAAVCAFASDTRPMITATPSYDIVVKLARDLGRKVVELPLTPQSAYPVQQLAAEAQKAGGGLIYLVNPNNPTSSLTPDSDIQWLATHLPANTVLLVDEAYLEFADPGKAQSAVRYVREGGSVIVSRTFSKIFGMAGARAGYGCGRADLIASMEPFMDNIIPILGLRAAVAAFAEKASLVPQRRATNTRIRSEFCSWLRSQKLSFIEPHANFVFIDVGRDVKAFGAAMKTKGVAVGRQFPPFNNMCRVTIGTDDDMRRFREAYKALPAQS
jgi:histidinol-phosphate/aromatic aminotransferase/cobyric acid decarboxylase-like protein